MSKKKPYALVSREFGRGPAHTDRYATLTALAKAVKDQWQGAEYIDGEAAFHTDYCTFKIEGAKLTDLGKFTTDPDDGWRNFTFHQHVLDGTPAPAPAAPWEAD
jgi:hypothetical protein